MYTLAEAVRVLALVSSRDESLQPSRESTDDQTVYELPESAILGPTPAGALDNR